MNILNLLNFNVLDVKETEYDYRILVEIVSPSRSVDSNTG